ncbi:PREDICTED: SKP1-like protein 3 isoform X2 [Nicotiana attenuata]|uniref:SKP1-like protein 3 isoform X2 n=1 Tax=Nicotiana attenuata TaxID=49451 RepID=UPI000904A81B|nr:PREDICTED: SKP1-like protein 3 isoform X2 [Nicotiana attenuata]
MSSSSVIILKSFDGETIEVEENVVYHSKLIERVCRTIEMNPRIVPLFNVRYNILAKVIDFMKHETEPLMTANGGDVRRSFHAHFLDDVDNDMMAAHYMGVESLENYLVGAVQRNFNQNDVNSIGGYFAIP